MSENRPSKKQKELLDFIDTFIAGNGYGPSYREMMRALNYKSVSTVATHVDGLVARGYLRKSKNSARSLEVVASSAEAPVPAQPGASGGTRQEIEQAIERLQGKEESAESVSVLRQALVILGYEPADTDVK